MIRVITFNLKTVIAILVAIIVVGLIYIAINTFVISKDYLYGPPLLFIQNRYVSVDIYPRGFQSATIFTNNEIGGTSGVQEIGILRALLNKHGVRGVFFVVPNLGRRYPLNLLPGVLEEIKNLKEAGHEIAQLGTYFSHDSDADRDAGKNGELGGLSFDEQAERIREGKELLCRLGIFPAGFRAPEYLSNRETPGVLEFLNYLYSASSSSPPLTLATVFRPSLTQGILYPQHTRGLNLLEFVDQADPTFKPGKCEKIFERVHDLQGVFVYHTSIGNIAQNNRLELLDSFLGKVKKENTWCCTLSEVAHWWLAREKLMVETRDDGETFLVVITNKTAYPLPALGVTFLRYPLGVKKFQIRDQAEVILAEGPLPVSRKLYISIPAFSRAEE